MASVAETTALPWAVLDLTVAVTASVTVRTAGRELAVVPTVHQGFAQATLVLATMVARAVIAPVEEGAIAQATAAVVVRVKIVTMASALETTVMDVQGKIVTLDGVLETTVEAALERTVIQVLANAPGHSVVPAWEQTAAAPTATVAAKVHTARHVLVLDAAAQAFQLCSVPVPQPDAVVVLVLHAVVSGKAVAVRILAAAAAAVAMAANASTQKVSVSEVQIRVHQLRQVQLAVQQARPSPTVQWDAPSRTTVTRHAPQHASLRNAQQSSDARPRAQQPLRQRRQIYVHCLRM